ncbi:MAG TPA: helix-hairpin-helix domain-containing protein [Candidatus Paceibacterota bacterium]|nr:helix-hairpin-helix domain-containing protein [Candidatus Paceibacterota bacterium]
MAKVLDPSLVRRFEEIPNVGPRVARDFRTLGLTRPAELKGKDPYALYEKLCKATNVRHDPCLLDVFIAVTRFMGGEPPRPWWRYTPERKRHLSQSKRS